MPSGMALIVTLRGLNYACLEQIFMVPKGLEPSKFNYFITQIKNNFYISDRRLIYTCCKCTQTQLLKFVRNSRLLYKEGKIIAMENRAYSPK